MGYDKDTRRFGNTINDRQNISDEQRAREQAYQEYLRLREGTSNRGNYVRNDDFYGSYFSTPRRDDYSTRKEKNRVLPTTNQTNLFI